MNNKLFGRAVFAIPVAGLASYLFNGGNFNDF